jgi:hypothetical protein
MTKTSFAAIAAFFAMASAAFSDETKPASQLGKDIRVPANNEIATNVSDDAQAATILFDNLVVSVDPALKGSGAVHNQTAIQTKTFTVNVPYTTDQRSVTFTMDLRGYVQHDSGATIRLIACAGDKTKIVHVVPDKAKEVKLKGHSKNTVAAEHPGITLGDFQERIEFTIQKRAAKPIAQITLFLVAEHDTDVADAGGAVLAIDSLDLSIEKSTKAAGK